MERKKIERERMFTYSIEGLIGRLFTDSEFLETTKKNPEAIAHAYFLGSREVKILKDIINKIDLVKASELARDIAAGGYGCASGGD